MKDELYESTFDTWEETVNYCRALSPRTVYIVFSNGRYYIESKPPFIRTWETMVYEGTSNKVE
jgi:hypothetical protein